MLTYLGKVVSSPEGFNYKIKFPCGGSVHSTCGYATIEATKKAAEWLMPDRHILWEEPNED